MNKKIRPDKQIQQAGGIDHVLLTDISGNYLPVPADELPIPLTTKGDIYGYSTGRDRLSVGADGSFLIADAASPLGIKWGTKVSVATFIAVSPKTGNYTVLTTDSGTLFTNDGAVGGVEFDLPPTAAGLTYEFYVQVGHRLTINAELGSAIRNAAAVSTSGGSFYNDVVGSKIRLTAINATEWVVDSPQGTWTIT